MERQIQLLRFIVCVQAAVLLKLQDIKRSPVTSCALNGHLLTVLSTSTDTCSYYIILSWEPLNVLYVNVKR